MQVNNFRTYDFPAAHIRVYKDGTVREFPKFCAFIHVTRSREYAAEALHMLRKHRRSKRVEKLHTRGL